MQFSYELLAYFTQSRDYIIIYSIICLDTALPFKGFSPTTWPYSYCLSLGYSLRLFWAGGLSFRIVVERLTYIFICKL
nr:MAG TPA: hypothetical protein [Caudoviricetes sp.]